MKFGENTQLVEEIMDFIRNSKMFNNKNINEKILEVVKDFNEAQNLAWSRTRAKLVLYGNM